MNEVLDSILSSREVTDATGVKYPLHSHIDREEVQFLHRVIGEMGTVKLSLEVGCAYGISSLAILGALRHKSPMHTHLIIDPCQSTYWKSIGVLNLQRAGFESWSLMEEGSEMALPKLALEQPEQFDLAFIDGNHTFEHTFVDLFYSTRLVRVGGLIVVDDARMKSVAKAVSYFLTNPGYKITDMSEPRLRSPKDRASRAFTRLLPKKYSSYLLPQVVYREIFPRVEFSSMVAIKKLAPEDGSWCHYVDF